MSRITLVTGGAASGKSRYALERARRDGDDGITFIATCRVADAEMADKVAAHRRERPKHWRTVEADRDLAAQLQPDDRVAIVDCLTLLVGQWLCDEADDEAIYAELRCLCDRPPCDLIIVSNEVGSGIVPDNALARRYREVLGRANRLVAERADDVVLLVSGLPLALKGQA